MQYKHDLLYKDEVYRIIGAAMEVYNTLGSGFLEVVYQEALQIEFAACEIEHESQKELPIPYKGRILKKGYCVDFLVFGKILVEIKALPDLSSIEDAQVINYLKASGLELALLINFGADNLQWKRRVLTSISRQRHLPQKPSGESLN